MATASLGRRSESPPAGTQWRVLDLVVVAVIGATFGVVYWAWNQMWLLTQPAFIAFPPAQAVMYGVWMLPQVLAAFIVRRRGAALFGSVSAVVVSVFLGNVFGLTVLIYGAAQGLAAETVFAATRYRVWNWLTAGVATMLAAICGTFLDVLIYFPYWASEWKIVYLALGGASGFVLGSILAPLVTRRLASAGVLEGMAAGRAARLVGEPGTDRRGGSPGGQK